MCEWSVACGVWRVRVGAVARITWRIRNPTACRVRCASFLSIDVHFNLQTCQEVHWLCVCVCVYFPAADAVKCVDVFPFPSSLLLLLFLQLLLQCNVMKCVCIKMQFEVQSYNIIMPCWKVTMCVEWVSACQCMGACVCPEEPSSWATLVPGLSAAR